ncbi:hypothetical protein [Stenotrophomonas acidaminiphila]|uniref:hypothetical protein n=1 Tax=Stenotrophomonas acidaminiphila TaxID=128780 RepID=UPI001FAFF88D|nr:hypothetical protein [Stenotrophomonas acidaminiphila]
MVRIRHRNLFQRTALLAMAALLWSQLALASHGGCLDLPGTPAAVAAGADTPHDHGHGCDAELSSEDRAVCAAHCSEGGISADSGRIPPVPPLFVGSVVSWFVVAEVADGGPGVTPSWVESPPRAAWHRPTAHPAALLLI